jgi:hypothetical protein
MLHIVYDEAFLAWSEELGLLRVLWIYVEDRSSKDYYVIYFDKVYDIDNKIKHCDIVLDNIVVEVPSFSSYYSYHIFETRKEADRFLNNNNIFKILR